MRPLDRLLGCPNKISRRASLVTAGLAFCAVVAAAAFSPVTPSALAVTGMSSGEIIARAETALDTSYTWGRESWTPNQAGTAGPDCSGYALKCWEVPRELLYQEEDGVNSSISPRYTSYDFYNCTGPWYALSSRSQLLEGDVLVKNDGTSGHVTIYAGGDAWNSPIIYEAPGTGLNIRRTSRYLGSEYQPRRLNLYVYTNYILVDNPSAKSTGGSGVGGNWSRSTSTSGYWRGDYQWHAATTASAYARWTPRIRTAGYYYVYVKWTSGSDRATRAPLDINGARGTGRFYLNQQNSDGGWAYLGSYYFNAGYNVSNGSVVLWATGANGNVIADCVMFSPAS